MARFPLGRPKEKFNDRVHATLPDTRHHGRAVSLNLLSARPSRGTSLGLSFRSRLAERLGTTIVIENKPGVLTRLALHLNIKTSFR
jgi:hypothetical protein